MRHRPLLAAAALTLLFGCSTPARKPPLVDVQIGEDTRYHVSVIVTEDAVEVRAPRTHVHADTD